MHHHRGLQGHTEPWLQRVAPSLCGLYNGGTKQGRPDPTGCSPTARQGLAGSGQPADETPPPPTQALLTSLHHRGRLIEQGGKTVIDGSLLCYFQRHHGAGPCHELRCPRTRGSQR